ncbi:hypothetical protein [Chromatocurvus halotolerans]|uniref:Secreted protein with PEP-CTERM sorting signal n=1 Tax=Chromatocurvus halotolerans TaxID=1132028 RepID=A0A4V2SBP3_9GAMM|nr:hypothetical protein [Chromatocurvus halotolerans]TCO76310.1 hypothetical protein EV688_105273 [Chromatocurvus halotolerans]
MSLKSLSTKSFAVTAIVTAGLMSSLAEAGPLTVDLADVSGSLVDGFEVGLPDLNADQKLRVEYTGPINATYDGYSDTRTFFTGGPNFVLGRNSSITVFGINFFLGSAIFEVWDLDTFNGRETVTFNPGNVTLVGVDSNINNSEASLPENTQSSGLIMADETGSIVISAGDSGAGFAIGGIQVNRVPSPTPLLLIGVGLLSLLRIRWR